MVGGGLICPRLISIGLKNNSIDFFLPLPLTKKCRCFVIDYCEERRKCIIKPGSFKRKYEGEMFNILIDSDTWKVVRLENT